MNIYNTGNIKLRRVFAFILDFIFSFLMMTFLLLSVTIIYGASGNIEAFDAEKVENILNKGSLFLLLRDFLFGGASLGKRIMGLRILDYTTLKKPPIFKTILRDLFFIILPFDAITMFVEGRSIGDRVANTIVVSKKSINDLTCLAVNDNTIKDTETNNVATATPDTDNESKKMKRIIITGVVFVFAILVFLALICFGWYSTL